MHNTKSVGEDCECITECVSSSFLVGCDEVMILTCERMNPYCLHSSNHRPLILPLPGPPLTIKLIQKQGMNNIFRNKMSPVRNLVRSLKRIVKLKAKRPTLNGWAYNKIQWSTHHPPTLNSTHWLLTPGQPMRRE